MSDTEAATPPDTTTTPTPEAATPAPPPTPDPETLQAAPASPVAPAEAPTVAPTQPTDEGTPPESSEASSKDAEIESLRAKIAEMEAGTAEREASQETVAKRLATLEADNAVLRKDARKRVLADAGVAEVNHQFVPDYDMTTQEGKSKTEAWLKEHSIFVQTTQTPPPREPDPVADKRAEFMNRHLGIKSSRLRRVN